MVMGKT